MILVVGATGLVGSQVCQQLAAAGHPVRGLVRPTADPERLAALRAAGVELAEGDLRDEVSLDRACQGVRVVVSTATITASAQPGDSIETTDRDGQLSLVGAAERAGAEHMVLLSFVEQPVDSPLQQAKRAVERRLIEGPLAYTVLRPTYFMEGWLSPALGFDIPNRTVRVIDGGTVGHTWISVSDVIGSVVGAIDNPAARDAVLDLGGPDVLSMVDAVKIFEEVTGDTFTVTDVPAARLRAELDAAPDSLSRSFAAMTLALAHEFRLDPEPAVAAIPLAHRVSVREYAQQATAG